MKKTLILISVLVFVLAFGGCSQQAATPTDVVEQATPAKEPTEPQQEATPEPEQAASNEKILIYLSGPEAMIDKLEAEFEAENGDVCDFVKMSCGQVRSKVWAEKEAGSIQADVIWGSDPLLYNKLDDEGLLQSVKLKDQEKIQEKFVVNGRAYALVNERYVTIIYDKNLLQETPPTKYADLTDAKYNGMVVKADASQSATAFAITSALYQLMGGNADYFQGLKDNGVLLAKSNGQVPSKIMEGQFPVGIGPHDGVIRLQNKGKKEGYEVPLEIVWPEEGVIAIQRPIAMVKNENRSEAKEKVATKLINFLVGKKAQTITTKFGFVSVRTDIENTYLPEGVQVYNVDWEKAVENEQAVKEAYQGIFHK